MINLLIDNKDDFLKRYSMGWLLLTLN